MDDGSKKVSSEGAEATSTKKARTKKDRPAKEAKVKRSKVENPVVFAFRLSEAERTRIHDAAGSGKASQFVLTAALTAADKVLTARTAK